MSSLEQKHSDLDRKAPRGLLRWLWRDYLYTQKWWMVTAFILMAVEGGMLGVLSYMVQPMFDKIFVNGEKSSVVLIAFLVMTIFIARAASGFTQRIVMSVIAQRVVALMQGDILRHMMTLDSVFFQNNAPGALIERVRGDTQAVQSAWSVVISAVGRDTIALLSLLGVAMSIDWVWTLFAIAGAPIFIVPILLVQKLIRKTTRRARTESAGLSTRLDEIFHGINPIKLNNLEDMELGRFVRGVKALVKSNIQSSAGQAAVPAMMDLVGGIGFFGVLTYGGFQIIGGEKTVGEFMSFFTAMALLFEPLRRLGGVSASWQASVASLERLHHIFAEKPGILDPEDPVELPENGARADIKLENVHFRYDEAPVLDGLSFTAEAGKTTALVGASGAGKSTVFNVLTRLVEPQSGSVKIGDVDIDSLELDGLRQLFSVVTQDAALFDETLRENILLARTNVSDAELQVAIDAANVSEFAHKLANGMESEAGPRGSNLSGGQRQRVAIARAVLRNAPILLLDEPTSALDAQSEASVQEALDGLSEGRTTLVIAHRLSTILDADKIVVMDKGRVVDQGTHTELINREGIYQGLYRLQFDG